MRPLLLSNSTAYGRTFLAHALEPIAEVLGPARRIAFVPFAPADHDACTDQARTALAPLDTDVVGVHTTDPGGK